jgi:hypothetical protein
MSVQVMERGTFVEQVGPMTARRRRVTGRRLAAIIAFMMVIGALAGTWAYLSGSAGREAARAREIEAQRSAQLANAYRQAWLSQDRPAQLRIAVTGTGPGLAYLANLQANGPEVAVTGTGPGLIHVAEQGGSNGALISPR